MPHYHKAEPKKERHHDHDELVRLLVVEMQSGTKSGPTIIDEEVPPSNHLHVYVIWKRWEGVKEEERGAIILDAYKKHFGDKTMLRISIAMGLTPAEDETMGISRMYDLGD